MSAPIVHYPALSKWLHWSIGLIVLGLIILGLMLGRLPQGPIQNNAYDLHKSFGLLVLIMMIARIANRVIAGAPPPEPSLARHHIAASHAVHHTLYLLLVIQPIVGLLANSAYGAPVPFFWLVDIPPLLAKDEGFANQLFAIHEWLGYAIAALAAVHIAAALFHHFIRKDTVLRRMAPRGWA